MKRIKQQFMEEYFCDPVPDYDDYIAGKCGGQLAEEHELISISQLKEKFKEFEFKNNINKSLVATTSFALLPTKMTDGTSVWLKWYHVLNECYFFENFAPICKSVFKAYLPDAFDGNEEIKYLYNQELESEDETIENGDYIAYCNKCDAYMRDNNPGEDSYLQDKIGDIPILDMGFNIEDPEDHFSCCPRCMDDGSLVDVSVPIATFQRDIKNILNLKNKE